MTDNEMKSRGLLSQPIAETDVERHSREARTEFLDKWRERNPDFARDLKQLTKDQLIRLYVNTLVGSAYDSAMAEVGSSREFDPFSLDNIKEVCNALLLGSQSDSQEAVRIWGDRHIAAAGTNTKQVAEIARIAGATLARIETLPAVRKSKAQGDNLRKGPAAAGKKRKEIGAARKKRLNDAIDGLFDTPDKPGWMMKQSEVVRFLKDRGLNGDYAISSINQSVKERISHHRKLRSNSLASELPNR